MTNVDLLLKNAYVVTMDDSFQLFPEGAVAIRAAVERAGIDPATIDEVFMGCVVPAGLGQAPARQAAIAEDIRALATRTMATPPQGRSTR